MKISPNLYGRMDGSKLMLSLVSRKFLAMRNIALYSVISFSGCAIVALVGNGFCNDETNNEDCNYDGGDCCVVNANTDSCSECVCHLIETCAAGYHPLVGNGFCNDDTNIAECDYDGGDCCSNSEFVANGFTNIVCDGICHDETNHLGCNYDGGDCCLMIMDTSSCSECNCRGSGVISSPGFPLNYDNNLDLTWLIQVQMGQSIEINFLSFDVEAHFSCR